MSIRLKSLVVALCVTCFTGTMISSVFATTTSDQDKTNSHKINSHTATRHKKVQHKTNHKHNMNQHKTAQHKTLSGSRAYARNDKWAQDNTNPYNTNQHKTNQNLNKNQNQNLEMRLSLLQKRLDALQFRLASNSNNGNSNSITKKPSSTNSSNRISNAGHHSTNRSTKRAHAVKSDPPKPDKLTFPLTRKTLASAISDNTNYLPFDIDVPGQAFVSTGPYVGVPISYAGTDLIINSPSVNTDLQLLGIRKSIQTQLKLLFGGLPQKVNHGHLLLSGVIETQAGYFKRGGLPDTSDINVTNVSFDLFALGPSNWLLGFIEFSYDDGFFNNFRFPDADFENNVTNPNFSVFNNQFRTSDSRVFVNKAFVTIGDLTITPIYGTFGQFYVPFGRYSSIMISNPLTKVLGRTKARAVQIGFAQPCDTGFYGAAYVFRGDSHTGSVSRINNGGLNLGFKFKIGKNCFGGDIGGGLIANLADSAGMQVGNGFQFFEELHHRVPAFNLRGIFSLGTKIDIITEFVGATTAFNVNDMSYKNHGAKPWASDIEIGYSFPIFNDKPSTLGAGWSQSHQALSIGVPMRRYYIVFNTSLFRSTLQQIEYRHDRNYASSIEANGPTGDQTTPNECTALVCHSTGRSDNAIQVSFDYYF